MTVNNSTRSALYARVSTKNNGQDPETQLVPYESMRRQEAFKSSTNMWTRGYIR